MAGLGGGFSFGSNMAKLGRQTQYAGVLNASLLALAMANHYLELLRPDRLILFCTGTLRRLCAVRKSS
jgi:hypothetical protein